MSRNSYDWPGDLALIGRVAVDSGTVALVDPCYVIPRAGEARAATAEGATWEAVCAAFFAAEDAGRARIVPMLGEGVALAVGTFYGDGTYPVYAAMDRGRPRVVLIDFAGDLRDEDDDEGED